MANLASAQKWDSSSGAILQSYRIRRDLVASAATFRAASESFRDLYLSCPLLLHQSDPIKYPVPFRKAGNVLMTPPGLPLSMDAATYPLYTRWATGRPPARDKTPAGPRPAPIDPPSSVPPPAASLHSTISRTTCRD
ncbi:hypothetical protein EVAR_77173_1 [Eumeta japonica]|uniref:Uncharacterized protein n=1 Tax=Eumeta variegata TaxID=151549 RepID=A0A4C1T2Q0_EUMVA|nr:hypothetical protein EVAR_77173_1 [Eumeta japonica]